MSRLERITGPEFPLTHAAARVVVWQLAKRRAGSHCTLTRGEVARSGRKLRGQKHTGRARVGDAGAPGRRGGGVAHGPKPRDYGGKINRRERIQALRDAWRWAVGSGIVSRILDRFPDRTEENRWLDQYSKRTLILTDTRYRGVQNFSSVAQLPSRGLNCRSILNSRAIIIAPDFRVFGLWRLLG